MSTVLLFIAYLASHFAAPVGLSLTSPETVVAGGFVKVSWTNANTANNDDWICFTKGDNPSSSSYLPDSWQYTYGSIDKLNQHPLASGSVSVKAPGTPGTYKLFYCENNGYTCKASVTVTVTIPKYTCRPKGETASSIKHVITIISENHSFDSYFGKYCRAPVGSRPTCTTGRDCCEMGIPMLNGLNPVVLNDQTNGFDPCHSYDCMLCQINDGKMDKYLSNGGCPGSDNRNYAMADGSTGSAGKYWKWASEYAMSDRFFQSAPGASSQSDMYYARGAWVFKDNSFVPPGHVCSKNIKTYDDPTIANLLLNCQVSFTFYAEGYSKSLKPGQCWPQYYDQSDDPFHYYPSLTESSQSDQIFRNFDEFDLDIQKGTLPDVSFVKALGTKSEHPGPSSITSGEDFNQHIIDAVLGSEKYKDNTIIILVPDESGGYRDSVSPPSKSSVDNRPYGPRIPFVVIGNAVKRNFVSHEQLEPASIIRFLESNYLADRIPGQLQTRDAVVNNLGSLFNHSITGFDFV